MRGAVFLVVVCFFTFVLFLHSSSVLNIINDFFFIHTFFLLLLCCPIAVCKEAHAHVLWKTCGRTIKYNIKKNWKSKEMKSKLVQRNNFYIGIDKRTTNWLSSYSLCSLGFFTFFFLFHTLPRLFQDHCCHQATSHTMLYSLLQSIVW